MLSSLRLRGVDVTMVVVLLAASACERDLEVSQAAHSALSSSSTKAWLVLRGDREPWPDLRPTEPARGRRVHESLVRSTDRAQDGLRARLRTRGIAHRPFWIVNAILVEGDTATVESLREDPDVEQVVPDRLLPLPRTTPVASLNATSSSGPGTAWGVSDIAAPSVWSSYGLRGEGIVVASIDTGVDLNHPALLGRYRGRNADGSFSHDYNWFDPTHTCFSDGPCDEQGHGTHTVGTILGADEAGGPDGQVGVAPGAKWIAVRACSAAGCLMSNLLAAAQWILAPTNRDGGAPRSDLRPHIVNNSWDLAFGGDPFYQAVVQAWVAAGIFPVFAAGNYGGACGSIASPADYPESFAVGAYDSAGIIAADSGRGASLFGSVKPDLAAPGVAIRSAFPGGGYAVFGGTSMAAPHVAGTVALMWSAAPSLVGDLATTRALLADSAVDVGDLLCGGTPSANNVWGGGRLNALEAVSFAVGCKPGPLTACGLRVLPSPVEGGTTVEGTLFLNGPAPAGGVSVPLSSDNGSLVAPPASVLVPAGAQSVTFALSTARSPVEATVTVRATYPPGQPPATASLRLLASPTVQALAFQPASVTGGIPATLAVTLSGPAPAGGATVALTTAETGLAAVPPTIEVAAGQSAASVTITPYAFTTLQNKHLDVSAAYHATSRTASLTISRTVPTGNALFDATFGAPKCQGTPAACDTGGLVEGRADILDGSEPHQPNTLLGQCADGTLGSFHSDESVDRIVITPVDAPSLTAGGAATVDVTVWCFDPALDTLQLFVADDARAPEWRLASTLTATASGAQTLTVPVTIPNTPHPGFRAQWDAEAPPPSGPCAAGYFTDQDDVVLAFDETPQVSPPAITAIAVPTGTIGATASATFTVRGGTAPYVVQALVDDRAVATATAAAAGDQVTFSLNLSDGPHSLSATVTDSRGQSASTSPVHVTADARAPTIELLAPKDGAVLSRAAVLRARASDDSGIAQVAFYADGRLLGADLSSPYSLVLTADSLWPGHHVLSAAAADRAGNTASAAPIDVITERPGTVLFDDFEDGDFAGWTVEAGRWSVPQAPGSPPRALYSSSTSGPSVISTSRLRLADTVVDAKVTLVSWSSSATLILAARYQDRDNHDFVALKGDGRLQLGRRRRAVSTVLATVPLGLAQGDSRHLELRAAGCALEARVDGIVVATARADGSAPLGGAMLSVQSAAAAFDDVAVAR